MDETKTENATGQEKPLPYLHPFQDKESRQDWKANLDARWFAMDIFSFIAVCLGIPYFATRVNYIEFLFDHMVPGLLGMLISGVALIVIRYYLFDKLPKWARLTYRIIFYTAAFVILMYLLVKLAA